MTYIIIFNSLVLNKRRILRTCPGGAPQGNSSDITNNYPPMSIDLLIPNRLLETRVQQLDRLFNQISF